ncbi:DUF5685 family protein [Streptomyces sp. SL13]|uniref:DUF5685 family protein n=1 Tax=Streptantibioticus silvisoli TaxID=2705255 RepID=A0AA90H702_9ACTN|nr:DUF5685 family protein [Streptantibioticus silvisoli]MDI5971657.1 DUF5685 family protein [Streptantibioticus silvisoli]
MFGIIRPCRHRMSEHLAVSWTAHLCGLCLALRDDHGQLARVATNYDGLVISVLVEAQAPARAGGRRTAGPCPLRAMRTAPVATGEGARLAAAVSLVLASAKVRDHVADRDGLLGRRPVAAAARRVADRWERAGAGTGAGVGFDTAVLLDAVDRQAGVEALAGVGTPLLTVTEPTGMATAAAFAHTAVLAGRPGNVPPLTEAGRLFGRLAHLLDAVEDLAADRAGGAWNPIAATGTDLAEVRRLCDDAVRGIRLALRDVAFEDGRLAHTLLAHEPARSVDRVFGTGPGGVLGVRGVPGEPGSHGVRGVPGGVPHDRAAGEAGTSGGVIGSGRPSYGSGRASYGAGQGGAHGPGEPFAGGGGAFGPEDGFGGPFGSGGGFGGSGGPFGSGDGFGGPRGPFGPGDRFGGPGRVPPQPPPRRGTLRGCSIWLGMCCTCQVCCRGAYRDPWSGEPRSGWCRDCDCGDVDCCDCCDCCEGGLECAQCCECGTGC